MGGHSIELSRNRKGEGIFLVFDTETTGPPLHRLVQIAWLLFDKEGVLLDKKSILVKPVGFTIPDRVVKIHGITTEKARKNGVSLKVALREFADKLSQPKYLIAHNIVYDADTVVGAEFTRAKIRNDLTRKYRICTKESSTDFCKIPGNGDYKWPSLPELYEKLFNKPLAEAHRAMKDAQACADCFFELKKQGVISVP